MYRDRIVRSNKSRKQQGEGENITQKEETTDFKGQKYDL
jgi:hypothetical protein